MQQGLSESHGKEVLTERKPSGRGHLFHITVIVQREEVGHVHRIVEDMIDLSYVELDGVGEVNGEV